MKQIVLFFSWVCIGGTIFSQNIPTIKATAQEKEKYKDWGSKPKEVEAPNPWVSCMMCEAYIPVEASSTLADGGGYSYKMSNLGDDNPGTAWVEGKDDYGIGEYIEFKGYLYANGIAILNGLQKNKTVFDANSRVKKIKVTINGKENCIVELEDKMGIQIFIPLGYESGAEGENFIRFEILEVYPGTKYKDTCISEIFTVGG
jgi:hypothetical protein